MFRKANEIRKSNPLFTTIQLFRLACVIFAIIWGTESTASAQRKLASVRQASRPSNSDSSNAGKSNHSSGRQPRRDADHNHDGEESQDDRPSSKNGLLNSVRLAVNSNQPTSHRENPQARPARPQSRHRHRGVYHRPVVIAPPQHFCPPPVVIHQPIFQSQICHEPVFVPTTTVVTPLLVEPPSRRPVPVHPRVQDEMIGEPMVIDSYENEMASIGEDWFSSTDSRFWATLGGDFDDLFFGSLGFHLQAPRGPGLDVSVSTIRESGMNIRDHLWLGDANLVYQIVRRPRLKSHLGIGVNWMGDSLGGAAGFNLTAGVDVKLGDNWSLTGEGDIGNLGDADFLHTKVALNRQFDSLQWTVGYEAYDIGGTKLDSVFTGFVLRF